MPPFQLAVLSPNFANHGSRSTFLRACSESGIPRYVHGKCFTGIPSGCSRWLRSKLPQRMGIAELLRVFVRSPVALPKKLNNILIILASDADGVMNNATSSA